VRSDTQERFRGLDPRIQRCVLNRGNLEGARDPTAAFISRMTEVERIANGQYVLPPGDWICINCADHQYMRNDRCRKCGGPKPAQPQQTPSEWDTGPVASEWNWNAAPTASSEWNADAMQPSEAMQAMAANMAGVAEASVVAEELPEMDVTQMRQQMMQMQQQMNIMASMMQSMAQMAGMQMPK